MKQEHEVNQEYGHLVQSLTLDMDLIFKILFHLNQR